MALITLHKKVCLRDVSRLAACLWVCCLLLQTGLWADVGSAERVRVASWNVLNYLPMERQIEGRYRQNYPKPEKEKEAMWQILLEVNPDVLLIQEMGEAPYLEELRRDLKGQGLDYPYSAITDGASDRVRFLAVLSKLPLHEVHNHQDMWFSYFGQRHRVARGLLEVVIDEFEQPLVLFTVHLKSRYTDNSADPQSLQRRRSEARLIRNRIFQRYPPEQNRWVLIAGDFNDHPSSSPAKHFMQRGDTVLSERMVGEDSRGEHWTHYYAWQESYSAVDLILVSPALKQYIPAGKSHIYDKQPQTGIASDHRLVWVDLELPRKGEQAKGDLSGKNKPTDKEGQARRKKS